MSENGVPQPGEPSILGSLPRTRPQRPSRRRASARDSGGKTATSANKATRTKSKTAAGKSRTATSTNRAAASKSKAAAGKSKAATSASKTGAKPSKAPPRRREPPAPRQGYESQEEPRLGATVHPPSGVELVESIATIFAELASAGLKAGGRVLKDALSPIRRP